MEQHTVDFLNKLESKLEMLNNMFLEQMTSMQTKLDIFMPKQERHEERIMKLEDLVKQIVADNKSKSKNHTLLVGICTVVGTFGAVIIGILIDHYLIK